LFAVKKRSFIHDGSAKGELRNFASSGAPSKSDIFAATPFCQTRPLLLVPLNRARAQIVFERSGTRDCLLQNSVGNINKRRSAFGNKSRR